MNIVRDFITKGKIYCPNCGQVMKPNEIFKKLEGNEEYLKCEQCKVNSRITHKRHTGEEFYMDLIGENNGFLITTENYTFQNRLHIKMTGWGFRWEQWGYLVGEYSKEEFNRFIDNLKQDLINEGEPDINRFLEIKKRFYDYKQGFTIRNAEEI